jgi:hypothetical protein
MNDAEGNMSVLQRECMNVCVRVCHVCIPSELEEHGEGSMSVLQRKCMNVCLCVCVHVCIPSVDVPQRDE